MAAESTPDCVLHSALRAGLASDLAAWPPRSITRETFVNSCTGRLRESDITAMMGIYNNTLHWLQPDAHPRPRNPQLYAIADDLRALLAMHRVPDVEFLLNADDYPKSDHLVQTATAAEGASRRVPLPLFSFCKREKRGMHGGTSSRDYDVLVPSGAFRMSLFESKLVSRTRAQWEALYPWAGKKAKAYFRGTPYCGIHRFGRCSRYVLPRLAHEGRSALLDVGLIEYHAAHDTEMRHNATLGPLTPAPREPETKGYGFKWLLHLDGHSFSSRIGHLLLTNSAVLKQQSQYIEYYYRALLPWVHYVPFYERAADDIVEVLQNLSVSDAAVQAVARRGQAFAHAHLDVDSRNCYWRKLLHGWRRRLAYTPSPAAWPSARVRDSHYGCGECRRPPNPQLIGPWPYTHPCHTLARNGTRRAGAMATGSLVANSFRECRQQQHKRVLATSGQ